MFIINKTDIFHSTAKLQNEKKKIKKKKKKPIQNQLLKTHGNDDDHPYIWPQKIR